MENIVELENKQIALTRYTWSGGEREREQLVMCLFVVSLS